MFYLLSRLLFVEESLAYGGPPLTEYPEELCEASPIVNHGNMLICIQCLLAKVITVAEDMPRHDKLWIAEASIELLLLFCDRVCCVSGGAFVRRSRLEISLEPVRGKVAIILCDHPGLISAIDITYLRLDIHL